MKLLKVCCFCEKWESGGIESFLHNVFLHMDLKKVQVDIVAPNLSNSIFTEPLRERGIRFIELSGKQKNLLENYHIFKNLLKKEKYDVVHLNIFHGLSLYYAHLAKRGHVPIRIAHSHNTALRRSRTRILKELIHRAAKGLFTGSATDLWACSSAAASFLFAEKNLKQNGYRFIPNGIEVRRFQFDPAVRLQTRKELGLTDQFVIGNVGRLCGQKNQVFLLEVFRETIAQKPNSRLLLIGEGEDLSALRKQSERLGIAENVIFYGLSDHVERLFFAMDVFAFPSLFEGLGIVAVEAQTAGLPVVASENVPEEAHIAGSFQIVPLAHGSKEWAHAILAESAAGMERSDGVLAARKAGVEIADVSRKIEDFYLKADVNG